MTEAMRAAEPDVLMVDDEQRVADAYALRLADVADVSVAYSGEAALTLLDEEPEPDVVLLDRHMPSMSGDAVLERIRELGVDSRVIMVTAVDPGLDVLDLPFDDYLSKPVDRADLIAAVDTQCQVLAFELLGEYFRLASTHALVASQVGDTDAASDDRLGDIADRLDDMEARIRRLLPEAGEILDEFDGIDREA
jgi:DNA-binding response OmpR family regulator